MAVAYGTVGSNKLWSECGRRDQRGTSGNRDCDCASYRALNIFTDEAFTISSGNLFQYTNFSNAERMLTTLGVTPMMVTTMPSVDWGCKNCAPRKVEKVVYYF